MVNPRAEAEFRNEGVEQRTEMSTKLAKNGLEVVVLAREQIWENK